jgi:hypothetical protein
VETGKNAVNRGDLRLSLPWGGFSLRAQVTDRRPAEAGAFLPEKLDQGLSALGGGIYHHPTGSRLLYGVLDEWGLPARLRSPWIRSVPFPEYHRPQSTDLRIEPSSAKKPEAYLYLGLPPLGPLGGFFSVLREHDGVPSFGGGFGLDFGGKTVLRIEGFSTGRELPPRKASAWFADPPPLPERDFRFHALGFLFDTPLWGFSSDWGYSETFAFGRDLYGNLGLRLGNRPWQIALAADGAGARYVGRDGSVPGGGFRAAARLDRKGPRNSLFRLGASLRAPGVGEGFDRSSTQAYYRFPAPPPRGAPFPRFSRVSLTLNRNAQDRGKVIDSLEGTLGFKWGPWSATAQGNISGRSAWGEEAPPPFPLPGVSPSFESARVSAELGHGSGGLSLGGKLGYTGKREKEGVWDASLSASIRGKPGRLSLKLASPVFPRAWTATVSWRLVW